MIAYSSRQVAAGLGKTLTVLLRFGPVPDLPVEPPQQCAKMGEVIRYLAPLDEDVLDWFEPRQEATNRHLAGGAISYTKPNSPGPFVKLHGA